MEILKALRNAPKVALAGLAALELACAGAQRGPEMSPEDQKVAAISSSIHTKCATETGFNPASGRMDAVFVVDDLMHGRKPITRAERERFRTTRPRPTQQPKTDSLMAPFDPDGHRYDAIRRPSTPARKAVQEKFDDFLDCLTDKAQAELDGTEETLAPSTREAGNM